MDCKVRRLVWRRNDGTRALIRLALSWTNCKVVSRTRRLGGRCFVIADDSYSWTWSSNVWSGSCVCAAAGLGLARLSWTCALRFLLVECQSLLYPVRLAGVSFFPFSLYRYLFIVILLVLFLVLVIFSDVSHTYYSPTHYSYTRTLSKV